MDLRSVDMSDFSAYMDRCSDRPASFQWAGLCSMVTAHRYDAGDRPGGTPFRGDAKPGSD